MFQTVLSSLNQGFLKSLEIFALTLAGAIPLGLLISLGSMNRLKAAQYPVKFIVWIVRGTPLMLCSLLIIYYGPGMLLETTGGAAAADASSRPSSRSFSTMPAIFRRYSAAASRASPRGQNEAGQVLGMTKGQIFFKVTLMQVIKRIVPPIGNEIITLVKHTSLVRVIAVYEIMWNGERFIKQGHYLAAVFHRRLLPAVQRHTDGALLGKLEKKLDYFKV